MMTAQRRILAVSGLLLAVVLLPGFLSPSYAQMDENKWMAGGSLHNWYSRYGSEIEEGFVLEQQYGLQWPAFYAHQDMQAAKALWIATTDFTDPSNGVFYPHKILHIGPRVTGKDYYYPVKFEMVSKYPLPVTKVDGQVTRGKRMSIDRVDPTIVPDLMIENVVNTAVGITMTRKIMQFSQAYHDNYIIHDYTFTNTGNTDLDDDIESAGKTLTGVYFYFHYRLSVCADTRYVIGNPTGWGINAMLDTRGDGVKNDADDAIDAPGVYTSPHMRIQYTYHGKYPPFTSIPNGDNLGGPIWSNPYYDRADTIGRLGAAQFVGVATLHCDTSPTDPTDDFAQPRTTSHEGSDEDFTSRNDPFNGPRMTQEYTQWIERGHRGRHVDRVEPTGNFRAPTGDPALGTPGGFSHANGYGPFTLAPGQSVRLVWAEGASGLSREACISVGRKFKAGSLTNVQKNDSVLTGKDSLFQTFRRAIANFKSGYNIPLPPRPPKTFDVVSSGDKIELNWTLYDENDPDVQGFLVYRAKNDFDELHELIATLPASARSFDDTDVDRGFPYFYFIQAFGDAAANDGGGFTPAGPLTSSRIWTQTYFPAYLLRSPGATLFGGGPDDMSFIKVVPNPYHLNLAKYGTGFQQDRISFFNIPGYCTIRIYTELGELIQTIEHTNGSGDEQWDLQTSSSQVVVSGIYLVVIENKTTGDRVIKKLSVIR